MIHAFALEPELVATWGRRDAYRFICDKFGLGTPRVMLELPKFSTWKRKVFDEATALALSDEEMKRIEELFRLFSDHKHKRAGTTYTEVLSWLENAEAEHDRQSVSGIVARTNPRSHVAVLVEDTLDSRAPRWALDNGMSVARTPEAMAAALTAMVTSCRQLHLVDPHFGLQNERHRKVLEVLMKVVGDSGTKLETIRIHCSSGDKKPTLAAFETDAGRFAGRLPRGISIDFVRWVQRLGGERLHNRYVLTDVGGVSLGTGLDAGSAGETDDFQLLSRDQYRQRWDQYVDENGFDCADRPKKITGSR